MKLLNTKWGIMLMSSVLLASTYAGDKKEVIPMQEPAVSRWSLSAGATVTSIKSTFSASPFNLASLFSSSIGGSTSLYTGGATSEVYLDGAVGLPPVTADGTAESFHLFPSQVGIDPVNGYITHIFHGSRGVFNPGGDEEDTELAVGPYIKLAYLLKQYPNFGISLFGQYSFVTTFDSGDNLQTGAITSHTFTYDVPPTLVAPPTTPVIFNAAAWNLAHPPITHPSRPLPAQAPSDAVTQTFATGITAFSVNIYLHTFTLGIDISHDLSDRVHLVLSTGPTLNLFDYDFKTVSAAFVGGAPVAGGLAQSDSSQKLRFGWVGQLGVQVDLDAQKRWFVEASGNYHWVQKFTAATPSASARIDASSWGASLGLGLRF